MTTIKVKCQHCKKQFSKKSSEVRRSKKLKRPLFCNLSCAAIYNNSKKTKEFWIEQYKKQKETFDIRSQSGNRKDEFSPFRAFLSSGRASIIKHKNEIDITEKDLKELWEKQKGICPYSNIKMILPETTLQNSKLKSLKKASLDRIDSSLGYIKGNVEFVCNAINNAKNNFTKEEMISFIQEIKKAPGSPVH